MTAVAGQGEAARVGSFALADPTITASPASGSPTADVRVDGIGFGSDERVELRFDSHTIRTTTTSADGSFAAQIRIPADASPGQHVLSALGNAPEHHASAGFLVRTDWRQFRFGAPHVGFNRYENVLNRQNIGRLKLGWAKSLNDPAIFSSPAVVGGVAYVGSGFGGKLYAVDMLTGGVRWTADTTGVIYSSPSVAKGLVFIVAWGTSIEGGSSALFAFDANDGTLAWRKTYPDQVFDSPAIRSGTVYITGGFSGGLRAYNARTGSTRWIAPLPQSNSSPAVDEEAVYVGALDGALYAFDSSTGQPLWSAPTGDQVNSSPVIGGQAVYVSSANREFAFDRTSGRELWHARLGPSTVLSLASASLVKDRLFTTYITEGFQGNERLVSLNRKSGRILWDRKIGVVPNHCCLYGPSPAVANGLVYITGGDARLHVYDASTGESLLARATALAIEAGAAVADGRVYVASNRLYSFALP